MAHQRPQQVMRQLQALLLERGIRTVVTTQSKHGSCYLFCKGPKTMGKIRVGDHKERGRYGYRWQIRTDFNGHLVDDSKGHRRFFYGADSLEDAARHMTNYLHAIERRIAIEEMNQELSKDESTKSR